MHQNRLTIATAILGLSLLAGPALAQSAAGPLLQPGEAFPGSTQEPIRLRLPDHGNATKAQTGTTSQPASATTAPSTTAAVETPPADTVRLHKPRRSASPTVASVATRSKTQAGIPFSFDENSTFAARPSAQPSAPPPAALPPARATASLSRVPLAQPVPIRQAPAAPTGETLRANLTKRGAIMFERGAPSPSPVQYKGLKVLAGDLSSALEAGAARIQLEAYGGSPGDRSSDARRLSLRRALAVRQLLIDDGVPSARIDVRAMGGAQDKGPPDRVDVFIRAG